MADWYKASLSPQQPLAAAAAAAADNEDTNHLAFTSRRSAVICRHAAVATSQPLASNIGLDVLKAQPHQPAGNAADAAVAIAAALAVLEPCSTGLGGDMFCLYYDAAERRVHCINGSGRSPAGLTEDVLREHYPDGRGGVDAARFRDSPHSVTVPGAAQGWHDLLTRHGSQHYTLAQLVEPAARLAQDGFPVAPVTAHHWQAGRAQLTQWLDDADDTGAARNLFFV